MLMTLSDRKQVAICRLALAANGNGSSSSSRRSREKGKCLEMTRHDCEINKLHFKRRLAGCRCRRRICPNVCAIFQKGLGVTPSAHLPTHSDSLQVALLWQIKLIYTGAIVNYPELVRISDLLQLSQDAGPH